MSRALFALVGYKPFQVFRPASGYRDGNTGDWVEDTQPTEFTINASEQPMPGTEKEFLPAAVRSRDSRKIMTRDLLRSVQEYNSAKADKIVIDGFEFEVHTVKRYQMGVVDHYEYAVVRTEQSAGYS